MSGSLIKYGHLPEKRTVFFLCDIQEKFRPALSHFEHILEAANKLVWLREYKQKLLLFFSISGAVFT